MDPFEGERAELAGALVTLEFGPGGRVYQMWASDPALPEDGEDFQFVLPPLQVGEESSEDYNPGTVLIGARTGPNQPWIVSRNQTAQQIYRLDDSAEEGSVEFEYELPLLEDIQAVGKWHEIVGPYPQVAWDLTIKNRGRISAEIGELAFPLAFNNFYDGFGWSDEQLRKLWQSRVYVHKYIGGGASWVFAQRMTAETPGLLVFPGQGTSWEFYNHVRSSLATPFQWEGIPVVYAYSKATVEREEWPHWINGHSSLILEPGDSRTLQMLFVPAESDKQDGIQHVLAQCGKPTVRLLPGAVAPKEVGIALEVSGASPKQFHLSRQAQMETDSDDDGAFCFIRPESTGPVQVSFEDASGTLCHAHLMFTEDIGSLIRKRAAWITSHQVVNNSDSVLHRAIVLTNIVNAQRVTDPAEYAESSGIESSLADALFLAEKNTIYPERAQIAILDSYIDDFLLDDVQNPATFALASVIEEQTQVAGYFGRPIGYPHAMNLYHSMYRVATAYGETKRDPREYLKLAHGTAQAMFEQGWRLYVRTVGILGYARIYDLLEDLKSEGMEPEAAELARNVDFKAEELMKLSYPFAGESVSDTSGFEEVVAAAKQTANDEHLEKSVRCAFAVRSLAPSWWWYGSDKRTWDGADSSPLKALLDRGEACLSHTVIPNSLVFFGLLDRDYLALPEAYMRMAFGGMLGPWALVRKDGAASMCYCPDLASKQAGYNDFTGASGLGYYHYLRGAGSYVLPNRSLGTFTFGCHFMTDDDGLTVIPWDGVGRKIVFRQHGVEMDLGFGQFETVTLDHRRRSFKAVVQNPADKDVRTWIRVKGLWGREIVMDGQKFPCGQRMPIVLPALSSLSLKGMVNS